MTAVSGSSDRAATTPITGEQAHGSDRHGPRAGSAIIFVDGLGSRGVLGNAALGQAGEQVYLNAANGNLMLRDRDQLLLGQGINGAVYRAYNSQGQLNWREGASRTVDGLTCGGIL